MENVREIPVNIEVEGKGTIRNKTMKVDGNSITIEGLAGAWFWIKREGCFRLENVVFRNENFLPESDVTCTIKLNGPSLSLPDDHVVLNGVEFEKLNTGAEIISESPTEEQAEEKAPSDDRVNQPELRADDEALKKLQAELEEKNRKIEELEGSIASLEEENKKLRDDLKSNIRNSATRENELTQKIEELELEKARFKEESTNLRAELESLDDKQKGDDDDLRKKLDEAKQRIANSAKLLKEKEYKISEFEKELQNAERITDDYKEELYQVKAELDGIKSEHGLTVQTYEKALKDKRNIFAKVNKWMTRVSGLEEEVNPSDKAKRIEKLVLERWNLLEENKRMRDLLERQGVTQSSGGENQTPTTPDPTPAPVTMDDELEGAFKYVVVSMYMSDQGNRYKTMDKIDNILNGFHVLDPAELEITEKDMLVIMDYFDYKTRNKSQTGSYELGAMINFFKDELEKVLDNPDITDPHKRVTLRQNLREGYDGYIPRSSR